MREKNSEKKEIEKGREIWSMSKKRRKSVRRREIREKAKQANWQALCSEDRITFIELDLKEQCTNLETGECRTALQHMLKIIAKKYGRDAVFRIAKNRLQKKNDHVMRV